MKTEAFYDATGLKQFGDGDASIRSGLQTYFSLKDLKLNLGAVEGR